MVSKTKYMVVIGGLETEVNRRVGKLTTLKKVNNCVSGSNFTRHQ